MTIMDNVDYRELHNAIEGGDMRRVRLLVPDHAAGQYLAHEGKSALFKAFRHEQYDIASLLILKGAKIVDDEVDYSDIPEIDLTRLSYLLLEYNKKSEKSCVFQLMSWSSSPQGLEGERLSSVMSMYEEFMKSDIIKLLMKVLESEAFDLVYDFESEHINRIHRLCEKELEIYGLTLTRSREIFIGAKGLVSGDLRKRDRVHGVVAEELCHLAMESLFENDANPYREEDFKSKKDFQSIVKGVRNLICRSCHTESVIKDVFTKYKDYDWECELIARVPHVIGIHGDETGRRIFMESTELSKILFFYENNVLPKCKSYVDPSLSTKPRRMMERIMKKNNFISFKEKQVRPLKEGFPSFRKYCVEEDGISVIKTNSAKLCTLHVYHELSGQFEKPVQKNCLFFTRKCFEKKREKILNALNVTVWKYLVVMVEEKGVNVEAFKDDYLEDFKHFTCKGMRIIITSTIETFDQKFDSKTLNYEWNDLSEGYKSILQYMRYVLKGEEQHLFVWKEIFPDVFEEEDINRIISGETFVVNDGEDLISRGYSPETYIEREFQETIIDKKIFDYLPKDMCIFITGLSANEFKRLSINANLVHWFKGSKDNVQEDKAIFINPDKKTREFEEYSSNYPKRVKVWLHYLKKEFYLRDANSSSDSLMQYKRQMTYREEEILKLLEKKRRVIISDNAGCGKSTVISSMISREKKNASSLVYRINLNKFSMSEKYPLSLAHIKENSDADDVFEHLHMMLGLRNNFEKYIFKQLRMFRAFIFFDGFDEIASKFKSNALKLLSVLMEETDAKIVVTTRRYHQQELEDLLQTNSHQLVPLSGEAQVKCLEKLWKCKMKFPNGTGSLSIQKDKKEVPKKIEKIIVGSKKGNTVLHPEYNDLIHALEKVQITKSLDLVRFEIDHLNLSNLAKYVLHESSLGESMSQCMGIPLHLYMTGIIHYYGNFNVELQSNIFDLYSQFVEQKILIHLEEKVGMLPECPAKDEKLEDVRKDTYRIHTELSDGGKQYLASEIPRKDRELCSSLGIVYIDTGVHFIHETFADFFKAEYLRKNINKDNFFHMLFEDKYWVVRRFLSSAIEKKGFEDVAEDILKDVGIFVKTIKYIIDCYSGCRMSVFCQEYELDYDIFCLFRIVKMLLRKFESFSAPDVLNVFIESVHELVIGKLNEKYGFVYSMRIGGCLTVFLLKNLLMKHQEVHTVTLFNFVRHSECPLEVRDVLEKLISIKKTDKDERGSGGNEKREYKADFLLKLLRIKGADGFGLLYLALCNRSVEIFAEVLKIFREVLSKEGFVEVIVKSDIYMEQMEAYIKTVCLHRICSIFKALHSVFGNEMESLFNNDLKFLVISRALAVDRREESSNLFEKVISLFRYCFEIGDLKEFLQSRDAFGFHIPQLLINGFLNRKFERNFTLISDIFDDEVKTKQLLKSADIYLRNVFYLAALQEDVCLEDLLKYHNALLGRDETKEMLLQTDKNGDSVIHVLVLNASTETFIMNLKLIVEIVCDDEWLKEFLKSKGQFSKNIFHFTAQNRGKVSFDFVNWFLCGREIAELMTDGDEGGNTCLFYAALFNIKNLPALLCYADEILRYEKGRFEELVLRQDLRGNTFLHQLYCDPLDGVFLHVTDFVRNILNLLKSKLSGKSDESFKKLLRVRNVNGETFLQTDKIFIHQVICCCKEILENELLEELL